MKKFLILLVPVVFLLTYCQKNIGGVTASELDKDLSNLLQSGDPLEKIKSSLDKLYIGYHYDSDFGRFEASLKDNNYNCVRYFLYDCAVLIYVYTDHERRYTGHEVEVIYSGL
ncbi:hypothetical protein Patl_1847 [Paraglaciecola sp. T6c]|nr:hypothetical protein Patl_1847 [Paraglaciecola sp. T6c]